MGGLPGVQELAVLVGGEADAVADEVVDDLAARPNHDVHALGAVLVVAGPHGVLVEGVVVVGVVQHADAALGQHAVAFFQ